MEQSLVPGEGPIDVSVLMERIRESIRREGALGLVTGEDMAEPAAERLREWADAAEVKPELVRRLVAGEGGFNLQPAYRIATHRSGLAAILVLVLKRLVRPWVRLYTDQVLERQIEINRYLVAVCRGLARDALRLEQAHAALRARCERLEAELKARE